jgi:alpha-beta hydrolase superfamily lysophospholipase
MSGIMAAMPGGSFDDPPAVPLLLLHGDDDPVVSITGSQHAFDTLPGPNYFVTLLRANHNSIFTGAAKPVLDRAAVAFLDAELKGGAAPRGPLTDLTTGSSVATLQVRDGTD